MNRIRKFLYKLWQYRRIILDVLCCLIFPLSLFLIFGNLNDAVKGIAQMEIVDNVLLAMSSIVCLWLVGLELKSFISVIKSEWANNRINFLYVSLLLIVMLFFVAIADIKVWWGIIGIIVLSLLAILVFFVRPYILLRKTELTPLQCIGTVSKALLYSISFLVGSFGSLWLFFRIGYNLGRNEMVDVYGDVYYEGGYISNDVYSMALFVICFALLFIFSFYAIVIYFNTITSRIITKK